MSGNIGYIGITDKKWFEHNRDRNHETVVFWRRASRRINLSNGTYFFFLIKGERPRSIKGYGVVVEANRDKIRSLWEKFGDRVGCASLWDLIKLVGKEEEDEVWYYVLNDVKYCEIGVELDELPIDFSPNIQTGKRIDAANTLKLLELLQSC